MSTLSPLSPVRPTFSSPSTPQKQNLKSSKEVIHILTNLDNKTPPTEMPKAKRQALDENNPGNIAASFHGFMKRINSTPTVTKTYKEPYTYTDFDHPSQPKKIIDEAGLEHEITLVGQGVQFFAYSFANENVFTINGTEIPTKDVILKTPRSNLAPATIQSTLEDSVKGYEHDQKNGVPLPKCYFMPQKGYPSGGMWLLEKMEKSVNPKDEDVLKFAKKMLINHPITETSWGIDDFRPENVMHAQDGRLCVIDFSISRLYTKNESNPDWKRDLFETVIEWSKDNRQTFDFLTDHLETEVKEWLNGEFETKYAATKI